MTETLLSARDVMTILSVSRTTLWRLCKSGALPMPTKLGRANRWRTADVEAYVAEKIAATTPMRPRQLTKKEKAAQIAAYAHAPRRKRRDHSAVIVDSDGLTADPLRINSDHHPNALSEQDRARLEGRLNGGGSALRWRL